MNRRAKSHPSNPGAQDAALVQRSKRIPRRALLLSLVTLAVPATGAIYAPGWLIEDRGLLLWLTPILPAFLLAYYRGWRGVAVALALGMVSLTAGNLAFVISGLEPPSWGTMFTLVVVYLVITNGVAALAETLHRERRAAERIALIDPLTGLANRRSADLHLDRMFAAAIRGGRLAVVMFDLDHFKRVNDEFGHAVGDGVIRTMGEVLERNTRRMNLAARFGGEEFLVVLSDIAPAGALSFAGRVREDLRNMELPCGRITVSAGVASYAPGMGSADVLVAAADRALYQAKESGRDRAVLAAVEPSPKLVAGVGLRSFDSDAQATVLVVVDDPQVLVPLTRLVEHMGYNARSALGGREALALIEEAGTAVDVLLTDVVMPDMNGLVLVDELTRKGHHIPVIYMSGQIHAQVTWSGISGNVAGFLQKPVEVDELAASIRAALAAAGAALDRADESVESAERPVLLSSAFTAMERKEVAVI
ncbi:MAG: diguanylate cyclase [Gemmatimonadota bacterium]